MRPFHYIRPSHFDEAVAALSAHGPAATLLAGGTDVLVRIRAGRLRPTLVIDVKRLPELGCGISLANDHLRIGARVTMAELIRSPHVQRLFPALAESARVVGSAQIRSRATL